MRPVTVEEVDAAARVLGLGMDDQPNLRGGYEQRCVELQRYKDEVVQAAWKRKALELHPDRNRGRDSTKEMAAVNAARDVFLAIEIRKSPPRPVFTTIVFVNGGPPGSGGFTEFSGFSEFSGFRGSSWTTTS